MLRCFVMLVISLGCLNCKDSRGIKIKTESTDFPSATKIACDSVAPDYFLKVNFPFGELDSLNVDDIKSDKYLAFDACDNVLFQNTRTDIQTLDYISLLDTTNFYCILVYRHMDMENCVFIYSFAKNNTMIDSELLFCNNGGFDNASNVKMQGKVVRGISEEKRAIFMNNEYISISKEFYSITDTLTNTTSIENGRRRIIHYQLNNAGRFIVIKRDTVEKEYAKIKYWNN